MSDTDIAKPSTGSSIRELTLRAVIIGGLITLVFTAANVYLGLKVGITFATSIPAAVISMAILRRFAGHTIQENNVVQTIASAAGTLSAIIFVLPGLIMVDGGAVFLIGLQLLSAQLAASLALCTPFRCVALWSPALIFPTPRA